MFSIAHNLATARAAGLDRLDADLLLLHALGTCAADLNQRRGWLLAHDADLVTPTTQALYAQLVLRRRTGEPLAYIVGHKEFFGLDLMVDPRVLIPRPDTEILVEWALECIDQAPSLGAGESPRLLDLGTGSGAIALAVRHARPLTQVDAVDASANALALARANAAHLGLELQWLEGSWFAPVSGLYDVIVSNPPYVRADDPHLPALAHEPRTALISGPDGLGDIRHIVNGAAGHLVAGGWLLLEHGFDQGTDVGALLLAAGFRNITARHDLGGHWRCTGGQWNPENPRQARSCTASAAGR
jgi:release factor glutamine methyltransferase